MSKHKKHLNSINRESYFFAYQSKERSVNFDNVDAIHKAAKQLGKKARLWENIKNNGKLINKQILLEIDRAETFVCDLTFLNTNVLFELGYAIGKRKPLVILLNKGIKDAKSNFSKINILFGIGYDDFKNSEDIIRILNADIDKKTVLLDQIEKKRDKSNSTDIFYIKSGISQAEIETLEFIRNSGFTQICDDKAELYQNLEWYLDSLYKCKNLIIHLTSYDNYNALLDNSKSSLYAGLGYALGKKVLFLAPKPFYPPIDYNDLLIEYNSAYDCVEKLKDWLPKKRKPKILNEDKELNLLKLGIGYSIAEDEKKFITKLFHRNLFL